MTLEDLNLLVQAALNERYGQPEYGITPNMGQKAAMARLCGGGIMRAFPASAGGYGLTKKGETVVELILVNMLIIAGIK